MRHIMQGFYTRARLNAKCRANIRLVLLNAGNDDWQAPDL